MFGEQMRDRIFISNLKKTRWHRKECELGQRISDNCGIIIFAGGLLSSVKMRRAGWKEQNIKKNERDKNDSEIKKDGVI